MVGWHLLLLLFVEAVVYGAIGWHAYVAWEWSTASAVALAAGIYLCVRILLVGAEFTLSRWKGDPIPPHLRVSPPRLVAMYLRELGGWLLMFSIALPFVPARRSVIDRAMTTKAGRNPVILVHGLACNRGNWFWFRRQLERRGHLAFAIDYTPWFARIDEYPAQLAAAIDEVLAATGASQVVVIGHSMGGLVARAYLDRFGHEKIERIVTLGTPHHGTWMARFGFTPNVRDMAVDSAWLAGLKEREATRSAQPYGKFSCVFTYHDNLVTPQANATLPGAAKIGVSGVGHLSLALSPAVVARIAAILDSVEVRDRQV